MSTQNGECEQYVYSGYGRRAGAGKTERVLIFESPLEDKGTLFMVQTPDGEERASFVSDARGGVAMRDMRSNMDGFRITRVSRKAVSERAGTRLTLA